MSVLTVKSVSLSTIHNIQLSTEFVKRFYPAFGKFFKIFLRAFKNIKPSANPTVLLSFYSPLKGSRSTILARFIAEAKSL